MTDYLCGNHTRGLPVAAFERNFEACLKDTLGTKFEAAAAASGGRRCSRARVLPHYKCRADTFKRVAETRPRPANVVGKGRFSLTDFLPGV